MRIDLIGCGCGVESLSQEACRAIREAQLLLGAERLLKDYAPAGIPQIPAVTTEELVQYLRTASCERAGVLFSGDSGFFSGAAGLLPLLEMEEVHVFPGMSSLQLLSARLGRAWQNWRFFSAHGRNCDAVDVVCGEGPAFFLTGGRQDPAFLCAQLCQAGLGDLRVTVAERLGLQGERIVEGTARDYSTERFDPLSVLLAEAAPQPFRRTPGLPDELFRREEGIPMTKQEIRSTILAKLEIGPADLCWDIGTGTGSVGIEMALQAKAVYGIECDEKALHLAERNRSALGAWRLRLIGGRAPEALEGLPCPDAVFVGGSGSVLPEILEAADRANPMARICISAVTPETLHTALSVLEEQGREVEICQIAVTRSRLAAGMHLMLAQNPVWLITGKNR